MTLGERIKRLRRALDLTQQEFAGKLGVSRSNIATYETGKSDPGDAVVSLICKTFNVSETWLRTGSGEMFIQRSADEELEQFISAITSDELIRRTLRAYWQLDEKEKAVVKKLIASFVSKADAAADERPAPDTVADEIAELKRQNLELMESQRQLMEKLEAMEKEDAAWEEAMRRAGRFP